jgi:hypothetical protein
MAASSPYFTRADLSPVGMIAESMLTESQFQELNGSSWILADGRDVTGTPYANATGQTSIPDLRGVFRRAKNNGRSDGNENPAGEKAIGALESDENASHNHGSGSLSTNNTGNHRHRETYIVRTGEAAYQVDLSQGHNTISGTQQVYGASSGSFSDRTQPNTYLNGNHSHTVSGSTVADGGGETRVKNITVNVFIKVA